MSVAWRRVSGSCFSLPRGGVTTHTGWIKSVTTMVLRYRDGHGNVTVMGTKEGRWAGVRKQLDKTVPVTVTREGTDVPSAQVADDSSAESGHGPVRHGEGANDREPTFPTDGGSEPLRGVQGPEDANIRRALGRHACPDCGAPHRVKIYKTQAAKQKAYRKRAQRAK